MFTATWRRVVAVYPFCICDAEIASAAETACLRYFSFYIFFSQSLYILIYVMIIYIHRGVAAHRRCNIFFFI